MLFIKVKLHIHYRNFSRYIEKDKTSKAIRQKFLDYFINGENHNFIRSSPVVPFCDPTVAFVNAGMNQFKGIFMGRQTAPYKRVSNSQKCVRVGGKHNDLNIVGTDGYHHTFFEMLGNWSFGDYFKKESCEMAWKLLTDVYKIPPSRLYVTYFKGDPNLGIEEDLETKEIWKTIGVAENRILAFGPKDNFWEMGVTGPCGPCTEIHVDHIGSINRANFVNKGLHDLTELWNIVFIEYKRNPDGSLDLLPERHVDTGMGFERLTSILQESTSNYNTDNFNYLLKAIHKNCSNLPEYSGKFGENDWNNLDTSYRILSDHTRMITACLADGVIPEQNQKLRRIMRKVFLLSETVFGKDKGLLKEISNYVIENLGPIYSEMENKSRELHQIIDYEEDVYKSIRKIAHNEWKKMIKTNPKLELLDIIETPALIGAYKYITNTNPKSMNGLIAFKLYDSFGLDKDSLIKLSKILNLEYDQNGFEKQLELAKLRSQEQYVLSTNIIYDKLVQDGTKVTDNSTKYNFVKDEKSDKYKFESLNVEINKIIKGLELVTEIEQEQYCSLLLSKTNFYTESGGQISDRGTIFFDKNIFEITEAHNCDGFILHKGFLHADKPYKLKIGDRGVLSIDADFRLKIMRNHTATHLLNACVKDVKGATCQKSSKVTDNYLNLDLAIFTDKLNVDDVESIEKRICHMIKNNINVNIMQVDSQELTSLNNLTVIPGEIYPDEAIRIIDVTDHNGFISREPCCGTHVVNTSDLKDFCITNVKSLGKSTTSIFAVTGERAKIAKANALEVYDNVEKFEKTFHDNIDKPEMLNLSILALRQKLNYHIDDSWILPYITKCKCLDILNRISKEIKEATKETLREFIEIEMKNAIELNVLKTKKNQKYMVHYLRTSMVLESVPLQKATKVCPNIPIMVISYADNMVKARCCVPKNLRTNTFNAEEWLKRTVAQIFKSNAAPAKGQDGTLVCNMKPKRISIQDWDTLLNESMDAAKKFIDENL